MPQSRPQNKLTQATVISMLDFIANATGAIVVTIAMIIAYMGYVFVYQDKSFKQWIGQEGEGSIVSAALGVGSIVLIAFILFVITAMFSPAKAESFKNGTWFNDTSVFLGIDHTLKASPQCVQGGIDDRGTSNLGIDQNIWRSVNSVFDINAQYTHHSCVLGKDRNGYDAVGIKFVWFIRR